MARLKTEGRKAYEADRADADRAGAEQRLVAALKRRRRATVADLVADTSLPKIQVEEGMRQVLHEYVGHLEATESGELLYTFPSGMRNQVRGFLPALRRGLRALGRGTAAVLSFLFKIWIATMLVGYFALFVALFVLALLASVAASVAGRGERSSRSRGPGIGGFFLVSRIIDLLFIRILLNSGARKDRGEKGRPLYRSVFAYVFGEKDSESAWEERERSAILRFVRTNKGTVTQEEVIRLTGRSRDEAERLVTRLLVEYEGEPQVTERGTIVYFFPELLRTRAEALAAERGGLLPHRPLVPFSANKPKTNRWITFFNAFNLVFGGYFLACSAAVLAGSFSAAGPGGFFYFVARLIQVYLGLDPLPLLGIGLGAVPVLFAILFFAVPLIRKSHLERMNEEIREHNLRRDVYGTILARPDAVAPAEIAREALEGEGSAVRRVSAHGRDFEVSGRAESRSAPARSLPRKAHDFVAREVDELAGAKHASVEQLPDGTYRYQFPELREEIDDVASYRGAVDLSHYDVGKTVFDSAE